MTGMLETSREAYNSAGQSGQWRLRCVMNRFFIYFSELRQLRTKFKNIRQPDRAVPPRQRLIRLQKPLCRTSHFILEAVIPLKELSWSRLLTCIRREWIKTEGPTVKQILEMFF